MSELWMAFFAGALVGTAIGAAVIAVIVNIKIARKAQ